MAESIQNLENSITNLSKQVDAGRVAINEQAATISHVSTILNDTVMTLVNSKRVGEDGKVGAVALANDLATAPIGDVGNLRKRLGLSNAGDFPVFPDANGEDIGTWDGLPTSRQAYAMSQQYKKFGWGSMHAGVCGDIMSSLESGLYAYNPSMPSVPYGGFGNALVMHNDGNDWRNIIHFPAGGNPPLYSCFTNDRWNVWQARIVIEGLNAFVDGSGFYKKSSPIFKLCDPDTLTDIGDHFTIAGYGASNVDATGVTAERVDVGHYVVRGSLGFSKEGWTIEAPRDKNNQPLVWLDTSQDKDGVITVKTYHRTYPDAPVFARNYIKGVNEADPIDIPSGRQVDLRLEMVKKESNLEEEFKKSNEQKQEQK